MSSEPYNPFSSEQEALDAQRRIGGIPKTGIKGGGGRGKMAERRGEPKSSKAIGNALENQVLADLLADGIKARKGKQTIADIGDTGDGDVCYGNVLLECKNVLNVAFPAAVKQIQENTPENYIGGGVIACRAVNWMFFPWENRVAVMVGYLQEMGYEVRVP